jgi:hypothetical protein
MGTKLKTMETKLKTMETQAKKKVSYNILDHASPHAAEQQEVIISL